MREFTRHSLVVAMAVLMTACANNKGDFGVTDVKPAPVVTPPKQVLEDAPSQPRPKDEVAANLEPALGFEVKIPERNAHPQGNEATKSITNDDIKTINDSLTGVHERLQRTLMSDGRYTGGGSDTYIESSKPKYAGWHQSRERGYMKFVNSGWIVDTNSRLKPDYDNNSILRGVNGYVFYQGVNPATSLPDQTIHYKGTWDFTTDAKGSRPAKDLFQEFKAGAGQHYGAFSYNESGYDDSYLRDNKLSEPVSHTSEFDVNFANKSLTGQLYRNKGDRSTKKIERIDRYTLNATLHGNRFRGSATATNAQDTYFGASSKSLEGGFFGDKAQELAGKFLADDGSLFAVFGARQHKDGKHVTDDQAVATPAFDAVKIDNNFTQTNMDTFGDATKLVVNGRSFSLLPSEGKTSAEHAITQASKLIINACCGNLDYVKFGNYHTAEGETKSASHLFLTGERTPVSQMPKDGTAEYAGTWEASILTNDGRADSIAPVAGEAGSRAKFSVNFGTKSLTGSLYKQNGASPAIIIDNGQIDGNGFTAKFKSPTTGLVIDTQSSSVAHVSGDVKGGFYGPNAIEMGGYFVSGADSTDKIRGVFGTKKQVVSTK